jgi:nucleotide-binding universal stress UspA family protein
MADILIPFDFSKNAVKTLDQALLIASSSNRRIELVHITNELVSREYPKSWKYDGNLRSLKTRLSDLVEDRKSKIGKNVSARTTVMIREAATISGGIISRMLQSKSRLLMMGTHGISGMYDKVFGSNTAVMVNHSLFPVLVIPHNWTPAGIDHCISVIKLDKLARVSKRIKSWTKFFNCDVEAVQFTISKEAEGAYAHKNHIDNIPCKLVLNPLETTLAEDVLVYTKSMKNSMILLFTREKTFLEKLFQPNLTYKLSGKIKIPLLALPYGE